MSSAMASSLLRSGASVRRAFSKLSRADGDDAVIYRPLMHDYRPPNNTIKPKAAAAATAAVVRTVLVAVAVASSSLAAPNHLCNFHE